MTKIKHIAWDFDGVIADSLNVAMRHINLLRSNGFDKIPTVRSQSDMADFYDGTLADCLLKYGYILSETKSFFDKHTALMEREMEWDANEIAVFEGVLEIFKGLTCPCSIISSANERYISEILSCSDVDIRNFSDVLGRETVGKKPEKLRQLCKKHDCRPGEVLYIGDLVHDILACRVAGVPIIAVGYGYHPIDYLRKHSPDYSVETVKSLRDLLRDLHLTDNCTTV